MVESSLLDCISPITMRQSSKLDSTGARRAMPGVIYNVGNPGGLVCDCGTASSATFQRASAWA